MAGYTLWFTGLPSPEKEKIAESLVKMIQDAGIPVVYLTDDNVRKTLSYDLGYTRYDWDRHTLRLVHMCYHITASDILNVVNSISPSRRIRNYGKNLIGNEHFIEIYVKSSKTQDDDIEPITQENIQQHSDSFSYEEPTKPSIVIDINAMKSGESLNVVVEFMGKHRIV